MELNAAYVNDRSNERNVATPPRLHPEYNERGDFLGPRRRTISTLAQGLLRSSHQEGSLDPVAYGSIRLARSRNRGPWREGPGHASRAQC